MAMRISNDDLELAGVYDEMPELRKTAKDDMKELIHLEKETENASRREYEKIISSATKEDRKIASKKVSEILKHAQVGLVKSDGDEVNNCIDAVFKAYFEDGAAGIAKALKMLEE